MVIKDPNVPYFRAMLNGDNPNDPNVPDAVDGSTVDPNTGLAPTVFAMYVTSQVDAWLNLSPATVNKIFTNLYNTGNQTWNENVQFVWWYNSVAQLIPDEINGLPPLQDEFGNNLYTDPTVPGGEVPLLTIQANSDYTTTQIQQRQCLCRENYGARSSIGNRSGYTNDACRWTGNIYTKIRRLGFARFGGNFYAIACKAGSNDGCAGGASRVLFLRAASLNSLPFISGSALLTPSDDGLTMNMNATVQPSLTSIGNVSLYQFPSGTDTLNWTPSQATATTTLTPSQLVSAYNYQPSTSALNIAFPLTSAQQALMKSATQDGSFFVAVFDLTNAAGTQPAMRSNVLQLTGSGPSFPFGIVFGSLLAIGVVFIGIKMMKNK